MEAEVDGVRGFRSFRSSRKRIVELMGLSAAEGTAVIIINYSQMGTVSVCMVFIVLLDAIRHQLNYSSVLPHTKCQA